MSEMPFAVVDVETTGFSPRLGDRIIEIAIVRVAGDRAFGEEYSTLVNPLRAVGASWIHGLGDQELEQAPLFTEIVGDVLAFLRYTVFVAHNVRFDRDFLATDLSSDGIFLPAIPSLCTLQFAYRLHPELSSHKLAACCEAAGMDFERTHAALDDARATAQLLVTYVGQARAKGYGRRWKPLGASRTYSPMRCGRPSRGAVGVSPGRAHRGSARRSRSSPVSWRPSAPPR